jgi:serine O-acetyltransferase
MPNRDAIAQMLHKTRNILFPGYFTQKAFAASNLEYCLKEEIKTLYKNLSDQIILADQHDCLRYAQTCAPCKESGRTKALAFIQAITETQRNPGHRRPSRHGGRSGCQKL